VPRQKGNLIVMPDDNVRNAVGAKENLEIYLQVIRLFSRQKGAFLLKGILGKRNH
jgi:hypothetical protein